MAVNRSRIAICFLFSILSSFDLGFSGGPPPEPTGPQTFIINGATYPALQDGEAIYVVSASDGDQLNVNCSHSLEGVTFAMWRLRRSDFDGPVKPSTGPVPLTEETLLIDTPDALTTWVESGTVLTFSNISPQLAGFYTCDAANLGILLTYENPYLVAVDGFYFGPLVDTLPLRMISRYADQDLGINQAPPLEAVTVMAGDTAESSIELTVISASVSETNPYETVYEVARPEYLVQEEINVTVNVKGLSASDFISLQIEDIYEGLMQITVVEEGEEVVFNCTPTNPSIEATFFGPSANPTSPNGSIWMFPALLEYTGFYTCEVQFESLLSQTTTLVVYPKALVRDVTFFDISDLFLLPNAYILLNTPAREGLEFACVSRSSSVSLFSENDTLTAMYAAVEGEDERFSVGTDMLTVSRGERFFAISMTVTSSYGDTLTCKTADLSESVTLRLIPGEAYIAVHGKSSAVIDYGQEYNISFVFVSATGSEMEVLLNGSVTNTRPLVMDSDNDQIHHLLVQGLSSTGGNYTLRRSFDQPTPSANFTLTVTFPVVTVSMESVTVVEGGSFSLSCSSSIPGLDIRWRPPFGAMESPNIFIDGLDLMVVNASTGEEGDYTCVVLEMGEATIASASASVDVLITCPEHYAGGILWPETQEKMASLADCREADSRFSRAVQVSRLCGPFGWLDPNFSACTLSSNQPQMFVIFTLYYRLSDGTTRQTVVDNADFLQRQLDSLTSNFISENLLASQFLIFPGVLQLNPETEVIRFRYTINFNLSSEISDEIGLAMNVSDASEYLHCFWPLASDNENGPRLLLEPNDAPDGYGDTFGFVQSDICECISSGPVVVDPVPDGDGIIIPPGNLQRKRQSETGPCVPRFTNFQDMCSGTTAPPCDCLVNPEMCQCESLYVGNGDFCTLDQDGDTYPAIALSMFCEEGSTVTYCIEDSCPNFPNANQSDNSSCAGFNEASGVEFCEREVDTNWGIQWPFLKVGDTSTVPCGVNYTGNATRRCVGDRMWADPDVSMCSSRVFNSVRVRIALLLGEGDVQGTLETFGELEEVTSEPLFPSDVDSAIDDVDMVLTALEEDEMNFEDVEDVEVIFEVLDNLLLDGNEQSFQILEEAGAGQRVLNNVERYALYVARALQEQGGNDTSGRTGENIVVRAQTISLDELEEGYVFPDLGEIEGVLFPNGSSASISLPQQLLSSRGMGGSVSVASVLFRNLQSFLPNTSEATHPRGLVISSQVAERGGNGETDQVLLENPVLITFSFEAAADEEILLDNIRCVFWDFGDDSSMELNSGAVRWSTAGLRTESVTRDENAVTVVCASTHLTSFAVLVDVGGARIDSEALNIVSYIGLSISLACLLLTIIFFLTFGKKLFTAVHNFVHLNLAITLFAGYLVFAVGIELANHEKIPCNVVTALIQYFLLAAFCWMMCEGIMLYLMLVVVFTTLSKKWWFFFLLGWGIPVVFVAVGLGTLHEEYGVKDDSLNNNDYYKYCWLSSGEGTYAIWFFVGPMLAIIIINTVFLVMVLWSILKSRANRQKRVDSGYRVDVALSVVKASVILLPLLGLTWVFGLFAINENTAVFAWLFTIFNSLQGLFIFIFHVIRNDRIWGKLKKKYDTYSSSRVSKSTGSTGPSKYHSVASNSTAGVELKGQTFVDPDASTELKEPIKEEPA